MVAPSRRTRGGITTVLEEWSKLPIWDGSGMGWLALQSNLGMMNKLYVLVLGYLKSLYKVPRYDIIHFHSVPGRCLVIQLPVFLYALLLRKRIVVHFHVGNQIESHIDDPLMKLYISKADRIVVLAEVWRRLLGKSAVGMNKVMTIYNPAPAVDRRIVERKKQILFMAYLNKNKGYDLLIKAFSKVASDCPDWHLVIAGAGEIQAARDMVAKLGSVDCITVLDWVSGSEKDTLYRSSSVYCMASYQEGFPMSVLEAYSYGLALVTTPVGGLIDVVKDHENAIVFNFGDEPGLEDALRLLLNDGHLLHRLSEESIKLAQGIFSLDNVCGSLVSLYNS